MAEQRLVIFEAGYRKKVCDDFYEKTSSIEEEFYIAFILSGTTPSLTKKEFEAVKRRCPVYADKIFWGQADRTLGSLGD